MLNVYADVMVTLNTHATEFFFFFIYEDFFLTGLVFLIVRSKIVILVTY